MYSQEVQAKFNELADVTPQPAIAALLRELGDLMAERFDHTTGVHNEIYTQLSQLHTEFTNLSLLVMERLQNNEQHHADKITVITDKLHTLSNRFMAVEDKTDEFFAYVDKQVNEILAAIAKINE